jgi:hypothetical protein
MKTSINFINVFVWGTLTMDKLKQKSKRRQRKENM